MSRKKQQILIEDQITDFFTDAPQLAVETLLRVCTRIVAKRFPLVVDVKGNGKAKTAKLTKPAPGGGLKGGPVGRYAYQDDVDKTVRIPEEANADTHS